MDRGVERARAGSDGACDVDARSVRGKSLVLSLLTVRCNLYKEYQLANRCQSEDRLLPCRIRPLNSSSSSARFVNTYDHEDGTEQLADPAALDGMARGQRARRSAPCTSADLAHARELREALRVDPPAPRRDGARPRRAARRSTPPPRARTRGRLRRPRATRSSQPKAGGVDGALGPAARDDRRRPARRHLVAAEGLPGRRLPVGVLRPLTQPQRGLVRHEGLREPRQGAVLPRAPRLERHGVQQADRLRVAVVLDHDRAARPVRVRRRRAVQEQRLVDPRAGVRDARPAAGPAPAPRRRRRRAARSGGRGRRRPSRRRRRGGGPRAPAPGCSRGASACRAAAPSAARGGGSAAAAGCPASSPRAAARRRPRPARRAGAAARAPSQPSTAVERRRAGLLVVGRRRAVARQPAEQPARDRRTPSRAAGGGRGSGRGSPRRASESQTPG